MVKKRPSLKDYLSTGEVFVEEGKKTASSDHTLKKTVKKLRCPPLVQEDHSSLPEEIPVVSPDEGVSLSEKNGIASLLEMFTPRDRDMWEKIFAMAETEFLPLNLVERREDFRTMERDRFTLFRLEERGGPLLHVRSSVQIREPVACLLKWDETGRVSIFL